MHCECIGRVNFESLVQISGIFTPCKIYVCGRLDIGHIFNGKLIEIKANICSLSLHYSELK